MFIFIIALHFNFVNSFDPDNILNTNLYKPVIDTLKWLEDGSILQKYNNTNIIKHWHPFSYQIPKYFQIEENCLFSHSSLSGDGQWLALPCQIKTTYRHSFEAVFTFIKISNSFYTQIQNLPTPKFPIQNFMWVGKETAYVFVYNNNIHHGNNIHELYSQLTFDGVDDEIFYGVADWVYEEEIFSKSRLIESNENGTIILFSRINDDKLKEVRIPIQMDDRSSYDSFYTLKYPRPGSQNPSIQIYAQFLEKCKKAQGECQKIQLIPPSDLLEHIVLFFHMGENDKAFICWANREQTSFLIHKYTLSDNNFSSLYGELVFEYKTNGWIEDRMMRVVKGPHNQGNFFILLPSNISSPGDFMHIHSIDYLHDNKIQAITSGKWEVVELKCVSSHSIYYMSNEYGHETLHLMRTRLSDNHKECVSCHLTPRDCRVFSAEINPACTKAYLHCRGPTVPFSFLRLLNNQKSIISKLIPISRNSQLRKIINEEKPFFTIMRQISKSKRIFVKETWPNKNTTVTVVQNVLINVYGGPGVNLVSDSFSIDFNEFIAYKYNTVILTVDVQSSYGHGQRDRFAVKNNLGIQESLDIEEVINFYKKDEKFKKSNFCVWGWSYGGFLSLSFGRYFPGLVSCVVGVAPVTDWRLYDSMYTERYMGLLSASTLENYKKTSLLENFAQFSNLSVLIAHGISDDNVNFQNSEELVYKMVEKEMNVEFLSFPFKNHNIAGIGARKRLYKAMEKFLVQNLINKTIQETS